MALLVFSVFATDIISEQSFLDPERVMIAIDQASQSVGFMT